MLQLERGHFLSDEQKAIKLDMITKLVDTVHDGIFMNRVALDDRAIVDIVFSCLMMFNREILVKMILSSNMISSSEEFIDSALKGIKEITLEAIKEFTPDETETTH